MLEVMTVAPVNWNTEMGCLKMQLLKDTSEGSGSKTKKKGKLEALKAQHTGWAAQYVER